MRDLHRSKKETVSELDALRRRVAELEAAETERKRAEELFNASFISSPIGIYIVQDGKFRLVNPTFEKLFGYSAEELMGMDSLALVFQEDKEMVRQKAVRMLQGLSPAPYRFRYVTKGGGLAWVMETVTPIEYEGRRAALGNFMDITELRQAEEALRQSEERFKSIYAESPIAIEICDAGGSVVSVNEASLQMFGLPDLRELRWYRLFDDPYVPADMKDKLRKGEAVRYEVPFDFEAARRAGLMKSKRRGLAYLDVMISPLGLSGKGGWTGYLLQIQDITERRQAEEERRALEQKAHLASRLTSVGMMASGIAHEINNPLTGVIGFSQLLMQKDLPQDIKEDVEIINDGAKRVGSIVKRLLTFARQQMLERAYVNINEVVMTTLDLRIYEMETSGIKVTTELDPNLPGTIADSSQLQQAFLNIIINAEAAVKEARDKGHLGVKTEKIDDSIRVSFKDNGPGIAKGDLERIFDPFFTTRQVGEGTGLGLSICHGIVSEHGGRIYAESKLGKGATIFVELPIVRKPEQLELTEPAAPDSGAIPTARILAVDDEPTILQFLSRVLTEEGHQVETADNAEDAMTRLKANEYDLILLDIKLRDVSGTELYKRIRKAARSVARKVVFITGDVMGADTKGFLSRTKALHITKPFDTEQLKRDISRILAQGSL